MALPAVHHIEVCVNDGPWMVETLVKHYGFWLHSTRRTPTCRQWVVESGSSWFMVTQKEVASGRAPPGEHFTVFCCDDLHRLDSFFNVALEVRDVAETARKVCDNGGVMLVPPTDVEGVKYAVVTSCCGNIAHTLLNKSSYDGDFLPGFQSVDDDVARQKEESEWPVMTTHMDHVTFVCRSGETDGIMNWYNRCFGMKRFITNSTEDPLQGLMIAGDVGLRLKVMEYWRCAESGMAAPDSTFDDRSLKVVMAESLPSQGNSHVEKFLQCHEGPGLQHIGLHTTNMVQCVAKMADSGINFRHPPPTYYTEIGKLQEIVECGEDFPNFKKLGILLDTEADVLDEVEVSDMQSKRYLLQIFTHPLFKEDTFFMEIIQRKGAHGFGAGNVTALARSINEYNKQQSELTSKTSSVSDNT